MTRFYRSSHSRRVQQPRNDATESDRNLYTEANLNTSKISDCFFLLLFSRISVVMEEESLHKSSL